MTVQTLEKEETCFTKQELWQLMTGIHQKVENQTIQTDRQLIDEVMNEVRPYVEHI
ncbi:hypothetical protein LCM20_12450 [Halobacillus litoralis]|uniref:hypothetical protein n=1 Tax=Halobacillus litoralis TaxID=45668 RepID=UPI001CD7B9F0|nr:hypothetical protein [Halobacillus litoralis]MCA0971407.1 hypothetical protein [Halobacillus litoralis]